ncbi:MAG: protein phosphatase 2C domain-containing protein, partial [Pseudomonadota bacterium]
ECASGTHQGCGRERNEDNYLSDPKNGVWVVADGMGGEAAGDYASAEVIAAMKTVGQASSADDLLGRTHDRLTRAHDRLLTYANTNAVRVVGATVVVLLAYGPYVACVWSGDSRLYRIRDRRLALLSRDHNEVGELLARGVISREEARAWRGRNAVTRAVGVYSELELETLYGDLREGDTFVMCSDGLTLHVEDDEIKKLTLDNSVEEAKDALIALALERGGEDNVTVVVVRATEVIEQTMILGGSWRTAQ